MKEQRRCRSRQQEWMLAFDEGRVPLLDALTHLERCPDCRDFAATAVRVRHELSRRPVPEAQPAADMDLLARLRQESARPLSRLGSHLFHGVGSTSHRPLAIRRLTAAGAVALLLLSLHLALRRGAPSRGPRQPSTVLVRQPSPPSPLPAPPRQPVVAAGQKERSERHTRESPSSAMLQQTHGGDIDGVRTSVRHVGAEAPFHDASDDLQALNGNPLREARQWAPLHRDEWERIEAQVRRRVRVRDDFVTIPFPRVAAASDRQLVAATEAYKREAVIVDARLAREVTCAFKATALSDLCDRLRGDTGIQLVAGNSVADEKVTLFCEKLPLREVMRQLSRPFGYTWLRSGTAGEYRYELVQDLKSQLLEEELRNRDRNAALLSLEREIDRYRPYLTLSPDEALARGRTAPPADKPLLEKLANLGWGPLQMYFRLSPQQLAALRAGQELKFSQQPNPGEAPLPPDVARGVLQSMRDWRLSRSEAGLVLFLDPKQDPNSLPPAAVLEARALVTLKLEQSEPGQFTLGGFSGITTATNSALLHFSHNGPYAVGMNPGALKPDSGVTNVQLTRDPVLRPRVTVRPQPSCRPVPDPTAASGRTSDAKVTSAAVLEALHQATGLPIIADYYTHLYQPGVVSASNQPLSEALNQLADTMRLRWNKDGNWLQFRSASYYHDRLKEVPNRLLTRWAVSRRQHGGLTLEELVEIAQLPDAQLDATEMAEGARDCFGLAEWDMTRNPMLRRHLRYLAQFTAAQLQEAMSDQGLSFTKMSLSQQQGFISHLRSPEPFHSPNELAGATLRVDYTVPGWFMWEHPDPWWLRWVVPVEPGPQGRRVLMPAIRERTRTAALQTARRLLPQAPEAALQGARRQNPQFDITQLGAREEQIVPTRLALWIIYIPSTLNKYPIIAEGVNADAGSSTW